LLCEKNNSGGVERIQQNHVTQRDANYPQLACIGNGPRAICVQTFLLV
jgi:hypothetical protein